MAEIRCPMCGKTASAELEVCPHCQARLKPLVISPESGESQNKSGESEKLPVPEPGTEGLNAVPAESEDSIPGWLSNLRDETDQSMAESTDENADQPLESDLISQPTEVVARKVTDWLAGLDGAAHPEEEAAPSWLKGISEIRSDEAVSPANIAEENNGMADDLLDRLPADAASQEQESAPGQLPSEPETGQYSGVISREEDLPLTEPEIEETPFEDTKEATPDWLQRLQAEAQEIATEEISVEKDQAEVREIMERDTLQIPSPADESQGSGSDLPDWLQDIKKQPSTLEEPQASAAESGTLDWMKDLRVEDSLAEDVEQKARIDFTNQPDFIQPESVDEEETLQISETGRIDELSSKVDEPALVVEQASEQAAETLEHEDLLEGSLLETDSTPDWLQDVEAEESIPATQADALPVEDAGQELAAGIPAMDHLPPEDFPDWLSDMREDAAVLEGEPPVEEQDFSGVERAELPSWVEAMKPVESMMEEAGIIDEELEQVTESTGPLAGLSGVLPASPGLGGLRKPVGSSINLVTTDNQNRQSALLETLLETETKAAELIPPHQQPHMRTLRWIFSLVLILALVFPMIAGLAYVPSPSLYPPELVAAREQLFKLPVGSPVLLVFDYEPAYSGELEAAGSPMVGNLLFSGARLAILSTLPTGPVLADNFIATTQKILDLQGALQVTNLGYLSGGASGIRAFSNNPILVLPEAMDGSLPWQETLQDVKSLADFGALIVLTDDPEVGRTWIEQAVPLLGQKPMLMIISAQAEPMLRPYYESGQLKGLVTGLAGGKAYEQTLALQGIGGHYWDSFSFGLFLAELSLICGSIWYIVLYLRKQKSAGREEE